MVRGDKVLSWLRAVISAAGPGRGLLGRGLPALGRGLLAAVLTVGWRGEQEMGIPNTCSPKHVAIPRADGFTESATDSLSCPAQAFSCAASTSANNLPRDTLGLALRDGVGDRPSHSTDCSKAREEFSRGTLLREDLPRLAKDLADGLNSSTAEELRVPMSSPGCSCGGDSRGPPECPSEDGEHWSSPRMVGTTGVCWGEGDPCLRNSGRDLADCSTPALRKSISAPARSPPLRDFVARGRGLTLRPPHRGPGPPPLRSSNLRPGRAFTADSPLEAVSCLGRTVLTFRKSNCTGFGSPIPQAEPTQYPARSTHRDG
mmetsp:Transcript_55593/g.148231  ORF Transcript_55593/g.148231 Transcript_55593/m.148231 type:complete len:316 (-) Transcript_55593:11-958(-)